MLLIDLAEWADGQFGYWVVSDDGSTDPVGPFETPEEAALVIAAVEED